MNLLKCLSQSKYKQASAADIYCCSADSLKAKPFCRLLCVCNAGCITAPLKSCRAGGWRCTEKPSWYFLCLDEIL